MKMPTQNIDWVLIFKRHENACIIVANKILGVYTYGHLKVLTFNEFSNLITAKGYMKDPYLLRYLFDDLEIYSEITQTKQGFRATTKSDLRKYVISDFSKRIDAENRSITSCFALLNEVSQPKTTTA